MSSIHPSLGLWSQPLLLVLLFYGLPRVTTLALPQTQGQTDGDIPLPDGATYYTNPNELCLKPNWIDLISFYLGNYFTHAVTVRIPAAKRLEARISMVLFALFFPAWSLIPAVGDAISLAFLGKTKLDVACRAGALFMVVRKTTWEPADGDLVDECFLWNTKTSIKKESKVRTASSRGLSINVLLMPWHNVEFGTNNRLEYTNIHGSQMLNLPKGYKIRRVPRNAIVEAIDDAKDQDIAYQYSPIKALASIVQLLYAIGTLYGSRNHQVDRYGYAAFGLTVAPYLVMSLANLFAGLICPDFSDSYLVESSILKEATRREGASFPKPFGRLIEGKPGSTTLPKQDQDIPTLFNVAAKFGLSDERDSMLVEVVDFDELKQSNSPNQLGEMSNSEEVKNCEAKDGSPSEEPFQNGTYHLVFASSDSSSKKGSEDDVKPGFVLQIPDTPIIPRRNHLFQRVLNAFHLYSLPDRDRKVDSTGRIPNSATFMFIFALVLIAMITLSIIAIIGGISRFQPKDSTLAQQIWIMTWLAIGLSNNIIMWLVFSVLRKFNWLKDTEDEDDVFVDEHEEVALLPLILLCLAPVASVGMLVVVGQEYWHFGTCSELD